MATNIATQIERLTTDRDTIRSKLIELGLAEGTENLDACAEAIDNIENRGAVSSSVKEGETYTIPKGYHNGSGTVSGVAGGGNYTLQSKTVTPTKQQQNVVPDESYYGLSDVTVAAIPVAYQDVSSVTAAAGDVLTGKTIVSKDGKVTTGTMANNGAVDKTLTAEEPTYTVPKGYHDGLGKVKIVPEEKSATPTKAAQTIEPTEGKVLSVVTVAPIPAEYITTEDANATAADVLAGKTAYVAGAKVTGTMVNNGAMNKTIDGMTATEATIPAGYTTGGKVSLTDSIELALAAI
nr:MAG TPA: tail protein [Caudoviricetes sp.]